MPTFRTRLTWEPLTLRLHHPFQISYGVSETRQAFWLRLAEDIGWGEGTIPSYYHIGDAEMFAFWEAAARRTKPPHLHSLCELVSELERLDQKRTHQSWQMTKG